METGSGTGVKPGIFSRLMGFVVEMGRRRVWRAALAYSAVVFVLLQIGEIVFPAFGAPDWSLRVLVVACFLGFPVVLCLSWVFDITAHGIEVTGGSERSSSRLSNRLSNTSLPRLSLLAVTLSIVGGLGWWTVQDTIRTESEAPAPAGTGDVLPAVTEDARTTVRSLAVLPLDDFSDAEGGEYFTAGLHEELTARIGKIPETRVLSRTSVVQFDRSGKAMPAIAGALGVDGVVEGSVFRSGNRVRITVQLIHGPSDTHLWANSYEGTTEDPIALQREIAETIAAEIQAFLFGTEDTRPQESRIAAGTEPQESRVAAAPEAQESRIALADDSAFSAARMGLAEARTRLDIQSAQVDPERGVAVARRLAAGAHYQEAEDALKQIVLTIPDNVKAWVALEELATLQGRFEEVAVLRRQRLTELPRDEEATAQDEWASVQKLEESLAAGEDGFWTWKLGELARLEASGEGFSPVEMARAMVGVGRSEDAFPYLETAVAQGDRKLLTLWMDPGWSEMRGDPRFEEILRRVRESGRDHHLPIPPWPQ